MAQDNELLKESLKDNDFATTDYMKAELSDVRENYSRITHKSDWTKIDTVALNESTEGGEALIYFGEDGREKFTVRYYGEMGQSLTEYFLMDGSLSLVRERRLEYNRPIYWDEEQRRESEDTEAFDPKKSILFETRTYFIDGDPVHQIDNQDCGAPFNQEYVENEGKRIWDSFSELINTIDASQSHEDRTLIGIWQGIPFLGSGWADNYQFFEDGRFHFNHNQMACDDSLITESGTYSILGNTIQLNYTTYKVLSGATLEPATGSCASEYELVGGTIVERRLRRIETLELEFVSPLFDYEYLERILLNGSEYFRMRHDPNDYE